MITFIESPYFGNPDACRYLACCILDVFQRGEIPFASHGLFPLGLPEHVELDRPIGGNRMTGRELGLQSAHTLKVALRANNVPFIVAFYTELGWSSGMSEAVNDAGLIGCNTASRLLGGQAARIWNAGEWPTLARLTPNH